MTQLFKTDIIKNHRNCKFVSVSDFIVKLNKKYSNVKILAQTIIKYDYQCYFTEIKYSYIKND